MKQIIILVAMALLSAGAFHSWQERESLVQAALYSEGFSLSKPVKMRVADYHMQRGSMPNDNASVGLQSPKSLYGTSVKRIAINRGGVVMVDFSDRIGDQSMILTPTVNKVNGLLNWTCTSDSIDVSILEKLMPPCMYEPATEAGDLMHAIANKDAGSVSRLLATGIAPDTLVNRDTPLMLAAKIGDTHIVEQLLDAGAGVDNPAGDDEQQTPVMAAISGDHPDVASLLLSKGASVTHKDSRGMSALDYAVLTDRKLGVEQYVRMVSSRFNAELGGISEVATRKLVREEAEDKRLQALYPEYIQAAQGCYVQRLTTLFRKEGELEEFEMVQGVPLRDHIRFPKCVDVLERHLHTKPSYQLSVQAYMAARAQHCDLRAVNHTLELNPDLDVTRPYRGRSLLDRAVSSGCHDVVRLMIRERKLEGELDDGIIVRAISQAPQETLVKLISNLIAAKANVNGSDSQGRIPLTTAIAHEQPVVAKYLIDSGASVNAKAANGSYAVIEATKKGYEHLVLQMVAGGADLNARDRLGRTALFAAVNRGQPQLVRSLIKAGADTRITDDNGINALVIAKIRDLNSIKQLLLASAD